MVTWDCPWCEARIELEFGAYAKDPFCRECCTAFIFEEPTRSSLAEAA